MSTHEPLETRKNHNKLLLQEDALMFLLQCEHLFTPSNFTLAARLFATSEGRSIAFMVAFSEQMCQVASTTRKLLEKEALQRK
jgi:hypothetical protein